MGSSRWSRRVDRAAVADAAAGLNGDVAGGSAGASAEAGGFVENEVGGASGVEPAWPAVPGVIVVADDSSSMGEAAGTAPEALLDGGSSGVPGGVPGGRGSSAADGAGGELGGSEASGA
jgi:hypothetical protein